MYYLLIFLVFFFFLAFFIFLLNCWNTPPLLLLLICLWIVILHIFPSVFVLQNTERIFGTFRRFFDTHFAKFVSLWEVTVTTHLPRQFENALNTITDRNYNSPLHCDIKLIISSGLAGNCTTEYEQFTLTVAVLFFLVFLMAMCWIARLH